MKNASKKVRMTKTRPSRPVILSRDETRRLLVWWREKCWPLNGICLFLFLLRACFGHLVVQLLDTSIYDTYSLLSFSTNFKHIGDGCSHETRNLLIR